MGGNLEPVPALALVAEAGPTGQAWFRSTVRWNMSVHLPLKSEHGVKTYCFDGEVTTIWA
eukprot:3293615-Amphidinium_carterae.1